MGLQIPFPVGSVVKFGGVCMGTYERMQKCVEMSGVGNRTVLVVSAPAFDDEKITDLLFRAAKGGAAGRDALARAEKMLRKLFFRVQAKGPAFKDVDVELFLESLRGAVRKGAPEPYIVSRGEYFSGRLISELTGFRFIDALDAIALRSNGLVALGRSKELLAESLAKLPRSCRGIVIPGFYGRDSSGQIRLMPRDASDLTAAAVARLLGVRDLDIVKRVEGILTADPRIVPGAEVVSRMTYGELRELEPKAIQKDVVPLLYKSGITIHVRDIDAPKKFGTSIVPNGTRITRKPGSIVGVRGQKGYASITMKRLLLGSHSRRGVIEQIGRVFAKHKVSIEDTTTKRDGVTVSFEEKDLDASACDALCAELRKVLRLDSVMFRNSLARVSVVGEAMVQVPGVAARVFSALAKKGISARMIDQVEDEDTIVVGVDNEKCEDAVRAVHDAFFPKQARR